jgi:hypothetical protein
VDNSPHIASTQSASIEPPDLPDGWRSAELAVWKDPHVAAHKRFRAVRVTLVVLALALVIGVLLWIAAAHYARGVDALEAHSYSRAVDEFSVARVLVFPYRDARSLEEQARRALMAEDARREQAEARQTAVVAQLGAGGARLEAGDADGVLTTLQAIDQDDLQTTLERSATARASADALAEDLVVASRRALGNAAWGRAGRFAAALLVLAPSSELAVALGARAQTGEDLSAKLGKAKDAARRGEWRAALRSALAVLAIQKDFPGAAAVVADARHALAPKPKPKPKPAATTAAPPTQATGGSGTTTPPPPPPPPPP